MLSRKGWFQDPLIRLGHQSIWCPRTGQPLACLKRCCPSFVSPVFFWQVTAIYTWSRQVPQSLVTQREHIQRDLEICSPKPCSCQNWRTRPVLFHISAGTNALGSFLDDAWDHQQFAMWWPTRRNVMIEMNGQENVEKSRVGCQFVGNSGLRGNTTQQSDFQILQYKRHVPPSCTECARTSSHTEEGTPSETEASECLVTLSHSHEPSPWNWVTSTSATHTHTSKIRPSYHSKLAFEHRILRVISLHALPSIFAAEVHLRSSNCTSCIENKQANIHLNKQSNKLTQMCLTTTPQINNKIKHIKRF